MMTENEYLNSEIAANCPEECEREIYRVHIYRDGKEIEWASSMEDAEEFIAADKEQRMDDGDEPGKYTTKIEYQ